jgi:hypothetical protein
MGDLLPFLRRQPEPTSLDAHREIPYGNDAGQRCPFCHDLITWVMHLPPISSKHPVRCYSEKPFTFADIERAWAETEREPQAADGRTTLVPAASTTPGLPSRSASASADREEWPTHQPEAYDAPVPGRQWYSACDDSYPRVNPETGRCEGCGATACVRCGREACPDHKESTRLGGEV